MLARVNGGRTHAEVRVLDGHVVASEPHHLAVATHVQLVQRRALELCVR